MSTWISWYLVITLVGWLAFPITYRLLPALKARGYAVSRVVGLLIWGYVFWLLASLGILPFDSGGLLFAAAVLAGLSLWALLSIQPREIAAWLRTQSRLLIVTELLFLLTFAGWTVVRAANPEAIGTEKPMELAFINAILRSPTFPPHDPWLSGYAISYYYFGYVLTAMLAKITGTAGSVAFNLGISLVFSLSACAAYGLAINLLNAVHKDTKGEVKEKRPRFLFASLLAPLFVLIVSNLEGFLQVLHSRGLFWQRDSSGALSSGFWQWLDIKDLNLPPEEPFSWITNRFWWWWRASRVLQDYDLQGNVREIIDEFPFFSFLLGDLHPHVLAMPFAFLSITLALNLFLDGRSAEYPGSIKQIRRNLVAWLIVLTAVLGLAGLVFGALRLSLSIFSMGIGFFLFSALGLFWLFQSKEGDGPFDLFSSSRYISINLPHLNIDPASFLLAAVTLGGMAFLNTWDFPVYVFIYAGAYALSGVVSRGHRSLQALASFFWISLGLGISGGILYLPFYLGFSSQAGGILPNLIYPTRGVHLWVMFAPLLVPITVYLGTMQVLSRNWRLLLEGFKIALLIFLALGALALFLGIAIVSIPEIGDLFLSTIAAQSNIEPFQAALSRRLSSPGAWVTLLVLLSLTFSQIIYFFKKPPQKAGYSDNLDASIEKSPAESVLSHPLPAVFAILLILSGLLLVLAPEFVFLRDLFGWRMNTIFKFYFQAWLIWSIAAAYCSVWLLLRLRGGWKVLFQFLLALVLFASLVYPVTSLWNKTNGFHPNAWTLDSSAYFAEHSPEVMEAIEWLKRAPFGVVAEAVPSSGGSYTEYARVSTLSGLPAVLGWVGHENQWRGSNAVIGSRQSDLERLYCTRDWEEARQILDQYNIRYIFIADLERLTYRPNDSTCPVGMVEVKFQRNLEPIYQAGQVTIYEYPSAGNSPATPGQP